MINEYTKEQNGAQPYVLTTSDRYILNGVKALLPGIALVFGPGCVVSLHSAEEPAFPCIAVENGEIDDMAIGAPVTGFVADILADEAHHGGKNTVGVYYSKTHRNHAVKCVINIIRNESQDLIGCMCICIDVSMPLHEFIRNFIPVVDNNLAESLSEPMGPVVKNVDDMIHSSIEQAVTLANSQRSISATERNKLIVKHLQGCGIFDVRSAVSIVAKELGVSRYTVYNYLKDTSAEAKS